MTATIAAAAARIATRTTGPRASLAIASVTSIAKAKTSTQNPAAGATRANALPDGMT